MKYVLWHEKSKQYLNYGIVVENLKQGRWIFSNTMGYRQNKDEAIIPNLYISLNLLYQWNVIEIKNPTYSHDGNLQHPLKIKVWE